MPIAVGSVPPATAMAAAKAPQHQAQRLVGLRAITECRLLQKLGMGDVSAWVLTRDTKHLTVRFLHLE